MVDTEKAKALKVASTNIFSNKTEYNILFSKAKCEVKLKVYYTNTQLISSDKTVSSTGS